MKRITLLAAAFALAALMVPGASSANHAGGTSCTTETSPCEFQLGADAGPVFVSLLGTGAFLTDAEQAGTVDTVTMTWRDAEGNVAATIVCTTTFAGGAPTLAGVCSVDQASSYIPGTQTLSIVSDGDFAAAGSIALSGDEELY